MADFRSPSVSDEETEEDYSKSEKTFDPFVIDDLCRLLCTICVMKRDLISVGKRQQGLGSLDSVVAISGAIMINGSIFDYYDRDTPVAFRLIGEALISGVLRW